MKLSVTKGNFYTFKTDLLVVGAFEGEVDRKMNKMLRNALTDFKKSKAFTGEYKQLQITNTLGKLGAKRLLLVGLGKKKDFTVEKLRRLSGHATKFARNLGAKNIATTLHIKYGKEDSAKAVAEGALLALYQFTLKSDKSKMKKVDSLTLIGSKKLKNEVKEAEVLANATNYVRTLVNTPANIVTPTYLANEAKKIAKRDKLKVKILGRSEMKRLGMNSLLSVARGSVQEPKLIILEHNPKAKKKVAVVGKGITFDTGGINLKPTHAIEDMKMDKAGACTVLGIMQSVAKLKVPVHVIGVLAATENMPGGNASKPGDIVKAYNRKTIEIVNTDAEGRLVLADAISYTEKQYKPHAIIDLATLTGACVVALGHYSAGLLGTNDKLMKKLISAGEKTSERVWQLPLWDDYRELVKGDLADVNNAGKKGAYGAGTINGASFIATFVAKTPWAHLDIAGTAFYYEEKEYIQRGATGFGVRLVTRLLQDWD